MGFNEDIQVILNYTHIWNWAPDWDVVRDVYSGYPNSYSVLTPFAFAYLEELIRSRTTEYRMETPTRDDGSIAGRKVAKGVIALAKHQNKKDADYCALLQELEAKYFISSTSDDRGDNRNSTMHGYMHPKYWTRESFEGLIHDIARLSPYAGF